MWRISTPRDCAVPHCEDPWRGGVGARAPCGKPTALLYFVSDASNWWNLYRYRDGPVSSALAFEAGLASPLWVLGQSSYALDGSRGGQ